MVRYGRTLVIVCGLVVASDVMSRATASDAPAARCDRDLVPVKRIEPKWPREALADGIGGWVVLAGTVGANGRVTEVRVVHSRPTGLFDAGALAAFGRWRFKPCLVDGVAKPRAMEQRIRYMFDGGPSEDELDRTVFVVAHRSNAEAVFAELAALCPERYRFVDSAANRALHRVVAERRRGALPPTSPLPPGEREAIRAIQDHAECLFSSWEQFEDPVALRVATNFFHFPGLVPKEVLRGLCARALPASRDWSRCAFGGPPSATDGATTKFWMFARLSDAYSDLVERRAVELPPPPAPSASTTAALEAAREAFVAMNAVAGLEGLERALADGPEPADRALLGFALGRAYLERLRNVQALAQLRAVADDAEAPWKLRQSARLMIAVLAIRTKDEALFDGAVGALDAELSVSGILER